MSIAVCAAVVTAWVYGQVAGSRQRDIGREDVSRPLRPAVPTPPPPLEKAVPRDRLGDIMALAGRVAESPRDSSLRLQLAKVYLEVRDFERCLEELAVLARQDPKNQDVFLLQALALRLARRLVPAEQAARRALALRHTDETALLLLGDILFDQQRADEALALYERCLKAYPQSYGALVGRSRALERKLQSMQPVGIAEMMRGVEEAVRLQPENPEGLNLLARMAFSYQNRLDDAERYAQSAARSDPDDATPLILLAGIALSRPDTAENLRLAQEYAEAAAARDAVNPRPPFILGRIYLRQGNPRRAVQSLERSLALGPMPQAVAELAAAYRSTGDPRRAGRYTAIYQRYTALESRRKVLFRRYVNAPNDARNLYPLVELYAEAGQPEDAEVWLNAAAALGKPNPRAKALRDRLRRLRANKPGGLSLRLP